MIQSKRRNICFSLSKGLGLNGLEVVFRVLQALWEYGVHPEIIAALGRGLVTSRFSMKTCHPSRSSRNAHLRYLFRCLYHDDFKGGGFYIANEYGDSSAKLTNLHAKAKDEVWAHTRQILSRF